MNCSAARPSMIRLAMVAALGMPLLVSAQNLSAPFNFTYQGAVEVFTTAKPRACVPVYTVPAGMTLRITDLVISNESTQYAVLYQYLAHGRDAASCLRRRTANISIPPATTFSHSYTTGIRFDQTFVVCVCNLDNTMPDWTLTGFLYK